MQGTRFRASDTQRLHRRGSREPMLAGFDELRDTLAALGEAQRELAETRDRLGTAEAALVAERERQSVAEELALHRLGELTAVLAHEVKDPLAGIAGAVQVLGSHLPEASDDHRVTATILARIGSLARTLDELVIFARTNAPRMARCSLLAVAEQAVELVFADPASSHLEVRIAGPAVSVEADAALLAAALRNLVANSAQAMHGEGLITIRASSREDRAQLCIEDDGPGMAPDVLARAFEPFFTTRRGGTGLGLPIVRRVVEMHGGTVTLASRGGRGVRALVSLPVARGPASPWELAE